MDRRRFCLSLLGGTGLATAGAGAVWALPFGPKLKWQKDLKTARKLAADDNKLLLIVFTAEWCTYCHKLVENTISHRDIVPLVNRHFVPVLLDFDDNQRTAEILEVDSLPATIVLSPQADLLARSQGYATVEPFRQTLLSAVKKQAEIVPTKGR